METKICTKCHTEYPATTEYFHKNNIGNKGLNSRCKNCKSLFRKDYYHNHKEKEVNCSKNWNKNNKDLYLTYRHKYNRKITESLSDTYIKQLLNCSSIPKEIIELKRVTIKIIREYGKKS
jgi:hypothetical protein